MKLVSVGGEVGVSVSKPVLQYPRIPVCVGVAVIYLFIYRAQRIEIIVNNYRYVYLHPHIFDLGCPGRLAGAACFQTGPCHHFPPSEGSRGWPFGVSRHPS